jgi:DNA polymerase-3 subunit delta'
MGRAIMLATSEHFNEIKEEAVQLLKYIDEMELNEIVSAIKEINKYKLEVTDYLDLITVWYRDVLLYKATKEAGKVVFGDQLTYIKEKASKSSYEGIEIILDSIEKAKTRLKANVNFDLVMELLLLTIKEN